MKFRVGRGIFGRRTALRAAACLTAVSLIVAAGIHRYNRLVSETVRGPVLRRAVTVINEEINSAVSRYLSENPSLASECFGETVTTGGVRGWGVDTERLRRAESEIVSSIVEALTEGDVISASIPSGSLTGISYLSGRGVPIRVRAHMSPGITSEVSTAVVSAGINQSLYRAILEVSVTADIISPCGSDSVTVRSEATLAERVIIGDVPLTDARGKA